MLQFIKKNLQKILFDVRESFAFRIALKYLPLTILLISFCFQLYLISRNIPYNYDEYLLTEISKEPLPIMLDTIRFEPHPIGFYLLLKTFAELSLSSSQIRLTLAF